MRRLVLFLLVLPIVAVPVSLGWSTTAAAFSPPTDAAVVDGWRPPATPYGPGNRGYEYNTSPGSAVRCAADGRVIFAGPVGGRMYVVVLHAADLRTTYGGLAQVSVRPGEVLGEGGLLGLASESLFFGVRRGSDYLDPGEFLRAFAHLVPLGPGVTERPEPESFRIRKAQANSHEPENREVSKGEGQLPPASGKVGGPSRPVGTAALLATGIGLGLIYRRIG